MRTSGLIALCLFLAFTAADGITPTELLIASLFVVLVVSPRPTAK